LIIFPDSARERTRLEVNPTGLQRLTRHAHETSVRLVEFSFHLIEPAASFGDVCGHEQVRIVRVSHEARNERRQVRAQRVG
jgi:hypothetical protein